MTDGTEDERARIRAQLEAAGLANQANHVDRLAAASVRLAHFGRLNRLGEDLLDEPAFSFDLPLKGARDER